jgi:CheY-like chemotaxis protein/tetratricopeptide (TPR) repeat protein
LSGTVLYIDDVEELPAGFARELGRLGLRLVRSTDGDEALRLIREGPPLLVLLEPLLVGGQGLELMERIRSCRETAGSVPIVIVTRGERSPQLYGQALELGATDFLCKPVLRAELLEAVLDATHRTQAEDKEGKRGEEAEATLSGSLEELSVPELLQRLRDLGATGTLVLLREGDRRGIDLRNGSPAAVGMSGRLQPLEDYLVRTKRISDDEHEAVMEQIAAGVGTVREILVGMGALTEHELEDALRARVAEPLLETFRWASGTYRFLPRTRLKSRQPLEQSAARVVFEGVTEWSPLPAIRESLRRWGTAYVSRAEHPPYDLDELGPLAPEPDFLDELRGDRSVAEILEASAVDERVLYGLIVLGFAELREELALLLVDVVPGEDSEEAPRREIREVVTDPRQLESFETALCNLENRISRQDDFAVLGVEENASDEKVRQAYERIRSAVALERIPREAREEQSLTEVAERVCRRVEKAYAHLRTGDSRRKSAALRREEAASRALEAESWFRKGGARLKAKRYDEAVEAFGMACHLDPSEGEYVAHLGYALYLSNPEQRVVQREALEHISKGIKLSPDREDSYVFLGRIIKATGEVVTARKMFVRALKINRECHAAHQELRLMELRATKRKGLLDRLRRN